MLTNNYLLLFFLLKHLVTRNAAPSPAQLEKLIGLLETRSHLSTGHARTANARIRMRNGWTEVASILNSVGNGCVKDWKQWSKYWKDKKAATKRKASMAEASRQRTGAGVDADVVELSELEQRILTIAGGLTFATGDRHLAINLFPEQDNTIPPPPTPTPPPPPQDSEPISGQSENLLLGIPGPSWMVIEDEPSQREESAVAVVGEGSVREVLESPAIVPSADEVVGVHLSIQDEDETVSLSDDRVLGERREMESPPAPTARAQGARRLIAATTPRQRRRLLLPLSQRQRCGSGSAPPLSTGHSPQRRLRRDEHVSPRSARASARGGSAARRRLLRRSPPSQRRSEMASLTERFIALEERRVDTENTVARALEIFAQGLSQGLSQGFLRMAESIDRLINILLGQRR